jgi:hypothetical protein
MKYTGRTMAPLLDFRAADTTCGPCRFLLDHYPAECRNFGRLESTPNHGNKRHAACLAAEHRAGVAAMKGEA